MRQRGGSFHADVDQNDDSVEFITPHYDEMDSLEPLDLSKMCLDDESYKHDSEDDDICEDDQEEEIYTRGRSRSRSVHENDVENSYTHNAVSYGGNADLSASSNNIKNKVITGAEKTGPLPVREVLTLKKGLEEATQQSMKQYQGGHCNFDEDEEERIASDVEKRQRQHVITSTVGSGITSISPENIARRVKILMLGDSGVGKSSLILRWTLDTFSPSLTSTVGVNFKSKKVTLKSGDAVNVQVWDTAGQEQFHKITTSYYKGAQGIMLVYDVTDQKSLDNVSYWIKKIKSHASDSVQVALIGNKVDLRVADGVVKKDIDTDRGRDIANVFGVPFFETSAKDATNVNNGFTKLVTQILEGLNPGKAMINSQSVGSVQSTTQGIAERRSIVEKIEHSSRSNQLFGSLLTNKDRRNSNSFAMKSSVIQSTAVNGSLPSSSGSSNTGEKEKCNIS